MKSFENLQKAARAEWKAFSAPGKLRVLVGSATCGRAAGSLEVLKAFETELKKHNLDAETSLVEVGCLGACYAEVLAEIRGRDGKRVLYNGVDPRVVPKLVESHLVRGEPLLNRAFAVMDGAPLDGVPSFEQMPMIREQVRIVLRNCGIIDPGNIRHYIGRGGYSGLARALQLKAEDVIEEVKSSGLRGRGGAGFPTGVKWQLARKSPGDVKYVICNADEGDPGAFMNRSLLEGDPHAVLEGLVISGYAIGASTGYVYCRAEYPLAVERIQGAIAQMRENGLLGENILGSGFSFDIQLKKGAGAFVCGEETALMQSIEGRRGMPRSRPPFPAVAGLFGKPTNINNVETLAAVTAILEKGAAFYAGYGTEKSRGTKTFALAGKINRTGLIEVPMGIPLRTVIEDIGGGVLAGRKFKAVQTGGPSGGCIPSEHMDIPVDYEHLAEVGSIMGSGGMVVIDDGSCMVEVARYFLTFTEDESCGKCVPCRMGTQHLLRMLTDITEGRGTAQQVETLKKISDTMRKASLCGLGQTAPNPVLTTLRYFEDEYRAHIEQKKCPAGVCREIIHFSIDEEACTGCRACIPACPVEAISGELKKLHEINQELCIHCGSCRDVCKFDAVHVE
jgi:NADH-quinone oxidoreductase subunit F